MQTQAIVSRLLRCCEPFMHAARWRTLRDVALSAVVGGKALSLAALALGTTRATSVPTPREMRRSATSQSTSGTRTHHI